MELLESMSQLTLGQSVEPILPPRTDPSKWKQLESMPPQLDRFEAHYQPGSLAASSPASTVGTGVIASSPASTVGTASFPVYVFAHFLCVCRCPMAQAQCSAWLTSQFTQCREQV